MRSIREMFVFGVFDDSRNQPHAPYNAQQVRELFRLINWMMHLRADLEERLGQQLSEFEEERKMPFVTSIERVASARLLVIQLVKICGSLPEETEKTGQVLTL